MGGDVMLGRRVGAIATADPQSIFADVAAVVAAADLAIANLESPLTLRPHTSSNPYRLEADPAHAALVAGAGFDLMAVANNHAGDAGPASVTDTLQALQDHGVTPVGGGRNAAAAHSPVIRRIGEVTLAFLAFDVSRAGLAATATSGIADWDPDRAREAVTAAAVVGDVVFVGIHGGVDEWQGTDPLLDPVARELVAWGADVVWGHGPHVVQPITVLDRPDGRRALVATSLGNLLFDQQVAPNNRGAVLEVLVDGDGLIAWRRGRTRNDDLRVHFAAWEPPAGDAALLAGDWWTLARPFADRATAVLPPRFEHGDVVAASLGAVTGGDDRLLLASYRHPPRPVPWDPRSLPVDTAGRSAHLGVFTTDGAPVWMARRPPRPVGRVAACDGSAAFAYTELDDPTVVAAGAGAWNGFGFSLPGELPGPGEVGCADVDGDGSLDPIVTGRPAG
jgi:hypothetical protein